MLWQEGTTHGEVVPWRRRCSLLPLSWGSISSRKLPRLVQHNDGSRTTPHPVISGGRPTSATSLIEQVCCYRALCLVNSQMQMNIKSDGNRHPGAGLGIDSFRQEFVTAKVEGWATEIHRPTDCWIRKPTARCFCGAYTRLPKPLDMRPENVGLSRRAPPAPEECLRRVFLPSLTGNPAFSLQNPNQRAVSFSRLTWLQLPWNNQSNNTALAGTSSFAQVQQDGKPRERCPRVGHRPPTRLTWLFDSQGCLSRRIVSLAWGGGGPSKHAEENSEIYVWHIFWDRDQLVIWVRRLWSCSTAAFFGVKEFHLYADPFFPFVKYVRYFNIFGK